MGISYPSPPPKKKNHILNLCIFNGDDRGCSWHWVCKLYLAHFSSPIICTLCWCQDKGITHSTQVPLARLEHGKETFYFQCQEGLKMFQQTSSLLSHSCQSSELQSSRTKDGSARLLHQSNDRLQLQMMRRLFQLPGLTLRCKALENTSISAAIRWIMGEFLLCWWELLYWTDAEENVIFANTGFHYFLKEWGGNSHFLN